MHVISPLSDRNQYCNNLFANLFPGGYSFFIFIDLKSLQFTENCVYL